MGAQLLEFYEEARQLGGYKAQMRLAMLTLMAAPKAAEAPDSPENLEKFRKSLELIRQEFQKL